MKSLIRVCPSDFEAVLADVGSAGGLKQRWAPARKVVSAMLFEPRDGGQLRREGRDTIYPVALGPRAGRASLNLTALPNMSSTLEPNRELLRSFQKKGEHVRITGTSDVPVDTLDELAKREQKHIDFLKIDTQGYRSRDSKWRAPVPRFIDFAGEDRSLVP